MKMKRVPLEAEVNKWEPGKGLEDGHESYSSVITHITIGPDNLVTEEIDGKVVIPYVKHRRGRTYIQEGDYIIQDADGTKHVCGGDKIFNRYEPVE